MSFSIIQALFAFLLVLAAIPVAIALVRRSRGLGGGRGQVARLAGGLALGPRERIAVVEVGGRWLVVGVTGQSINLLVTLDEPPADLSATAPLREATGGPFPARSVAPLAGVAERVPGNRAFARIFAKARERQGH